MRSRPYPRDARPNCFPAIHRGRGATCCLSASATERSPSTPPYCPNSSKTVASHFLTEWRRPFRAAANRASSGQGSLGLLSRVDPHCSRPLAAVDLPQPDRLGHPMSRNRAERSLEKAELGGPAVLDLLRTIPPGASDFRPMLLVGPSSVPSRER
jgi:hypothetical protein